ncbi:MAG: hypothetical protein UX04_C0009G0006 [Microgenomates group bacterium GW2011_GWF2_45_18]|nr:MAG: hypothetical protein UW18_C0010G0006 [Microgenomates group bacterium GW2011_GWF1_44_10]KKU01371.1 MAG: hypothetical protein UX04_C0009G0006 [Microgenomates group bacterium GW2011_GWF2_45_18]
MQWIYHILILLVPLLFSARTEELFEFNKVVAVYAFALLVATCGLIELGIATYRNESISWKRSPLDLPLVVFFFSQLLSTILSMHPRTSWLGYYSRFNGGLWSTISYLILYFGFIQHVNWKEVRSYVWTIVYSGVLVSLYAIPEHFGVSPSCFILLRESAESNPSINLFTTDCWVQDVRSRIFGTLGQPNWLAGMLAPIIVLATGLIATKKKRVLKYVALFSTFLMLLALLYTRSRSGLLAVAGGLVVLFAFDFFIHVRAKQGLKRVLTFLLPIFAFFFIVVFQFGEDLRTAFRTVFQSLRVTQTFVQQNDQSSSETLQGQLPQVEGGSDSSIIRTIVWKGAIDVWKRYPLTGSGVETFAYSYYLDRPIEHNLVSEWDFLYNKAHNEWLNYLATTGIIGLTSYLVVVFVGIGYAIISTRKLKLEEQIFAFSVAGALLAIQISNVIGFSTVAVSLLFFLLPTLVQFESHPFKSIEVKFPVPTIISLLVASIVPILFFFFSSSIFSYWSADADFSELKKLMNAGYHSQALQEYDRLIKKQPRESAYREEFAQYTSLLAIGAHNQQEATLSAQLQVLAKQESDTAYALNPVHLNNIKSRVRTLLNLAELNPSMYDEALQLIEVARKLSPTDPKLPYFSAQVYLLKKEFERAKREALVALELKQDYIAVQDLLNDIEQNLATSSGQKNSSKE